MNPTKQEAQLRTLNGALDRLAFYVADNATRTSDVRQIRMLLAALNPAIAPADPPAAVADEAFVLVPKELPPEILAASAFAMGTGNPKHLWDFIINKLEARNG